MSKKAKVTLKDRIADCHNRRAIAGLSQLSDSEVKKLLTPKK